jgi:hypothetical protein
LAKVFDPVWYNLPNAGNPHITVILLLWGMVGTKLAFAQYYWMVGVIL